MTMTLIDIFTTLTSGLTFHRDGETKWVAYWGEDKSQPAVEIECDETTGRIEVTRYNPVTGEAEYKRANIQLNTGD